MNKKVLAVIGMFVIGIAFVISLSLEDGTVDTSFNITKSEIANNKISIEYDRASYLDKYIIEITSKDKVVYKTNTSGTKFDVEFDNLINGTEYVLSVYADLGTSSLKKCENEYRFVWNVPQFVQNTILLNDKDYTLNIDASIANAGYSISIFEGEKEVLKESLTSNEYVISKELYEKREVVLTARLFKGEIKLDEIKLYNRVDPLTPVTIKSIKNNDTLKQANILFEIDGGDNADYYNVKIYMDKTLVKEFDTTDKVSLLSKNMFVLDKKYKIILTAVCGEFKKTSEVEFTINEQEQVPPVYLSNDWNSLKKGTKLSLNCSDKDAKILYTVDGSDPLTKGIEYKEPLTIDRDITLKTVALSNDKKKKSDSIVKTYNVHVGERKKIAVYISPSNQFRNIGVSEVGYTNEMDEMNDLSKYIIERLEQYNVKIYRNNSSQKIKDWVAESNEYKVDLHLAIHSNASDKHDEYGTETWIHTDTSKTLSLASAIQSGLTSIYPYKERKDYDRGVRYALGALGEVNEENLDFGILIEVAHHDDKEDAKWIMENKKKIGETIADSILRYYQVIE